MPTGASNKDRFARKRFTLPQLSSFARFCPALFFCTGLAIAPVAAEAQMIGFGGFGIGGGLGLQGLMHHGFGGGLGTGFIKLAASGKLLAPLVALPAHWPWHAAHS